MTAAAPISLVVSDIDGTLVTPDKQITPAARAAVAALHQRGIGFSLTSSRPGYGMRTLIAELDLQLPIGPFNGSSIVAPDLTVLERHVVPPDAARQSLAFLASKGFDVWLFTDREWIIHRRDDRYVPREEHAIQTAPRLVADGTPYLDQACKIVGVSDDYARLADGEAELKALIGPRAHVARSQNYYLDVTPPDRDKGTFVAALAARLGVPPARIATIGDMPNDVPMFGISGLSFAMGNASDAVKAKASRVTASNTEDGFAKAMEEILKIDA
jgi:Cof subfamily protein (haloacid dehalogenase superfamily)